MPAIINMLMPATGDPYAAMAADELESYVGPFAAAGLTIVPRPWDLGWEQSCLMRADATLALFAWGYHTQVDRWLAMLAAWPGDIMLLNPPSLLTWNTCKTYLGELAAGGVEIVPSLFTDSDQARIAAAFDHFGTDQLVIKPQISAGSYLTTRVRRGDAIVPLAKAIIQPFLPSIVEEGELSLFMLAGRFSHAARKVAQPGEFRVQPQFGGRFFALVPDADALAIAGRVIAALPVAPLYARVDLIRLPNGKLALMELEAIEPDLYPDIDVDVPARLADAVLNRIAQ